MNMNINATNSGMRPTATKALAGFPARRLAFSGIGGAWVAVASAESLMSQGQDALDDVGMIGENFSAIASAGLLHWLAGILLAVGLAGAAPLVWASRWGRAGWVLSAILAVSFGAFGMLHLMALETSAPDLDAAAMNQFLLERLGEGTGPWLVPILFAGLLGPWSFFVLLIGMLRVNLVSWVAPTVFMLGAVIHMLVADEMLETASLWIMAAGGLLAAWSMLHSRAADV